MKESSTAIYESRYTREAWRHLTSMYERIFGTESRHAGQLQNVGHVGLTQMLFVDWKPVGEPFGLPIQIRRGNDAEGNKVHEPWAYDSVSEEWIRLCCGSGNPIVGDPDNPDPLSDKPPAILGFSVQREDAPVPIDLPTVISNVSVVARANPTDPDDPDIPTQIIYVATDGNDASGGTITQPFRTINHAISVASAGTEIRVEAGTYAGPVNVTKSGLASNPIVIKSVTPHSAIIEGDGFHIHGQNHVQINGFHIRDVSDKGVDILGPSEGLTIEHNKFYNSVSSAIGAWGVLWEQDPSVYNYRGITNLTIQHNDIKKACNGGWNEQITLANGVSNFLIKANEISDSGDSTFGGEGIDVKEGCSHGLLCGNYIHNIDRQGIYVDAGGRFPDHNVPDTHNIRIFGNRIVSVGSEGMTIGTEGSAGVRRITARDNVIMNSERTGILVYLHPTGSGISNDIMINNNDCINNGLEVGHGGGGIEINYPGATDIVIDSNHVYGNSDFQIQVSTGSDALLTENKETE